jgi:hypothetical protein
MDKEAKARENRLRRMAERQGLRLLKCRRRDPLSIGYGLYELVSIRSHRTPDTYTQTLDQVEATLTDTTRRSR